ncbi:Sec23/Sec24 trunk domain-containing protein [Pisolithus sp. B1]|nr:Sec23/Sec24 trunk domain-containing protein [Pisolithus sp. B1]
MLCKCSPRWTFESLGMIRKYMLCHMHPTLLQHFLHYHRLHTLSHPAQVPPIFFFVVNTYLVDKEDLKALRKAISQSHLTKIQKLLGLSTPVRAAPHSCQPMPQQAFSAAQSLLPMQQVEFQLTGILESLLHDSWPVVNERFALSVTVRLLQMTYYLSTGSRTMLFDGGPAMEGPGMMVSNELKDSHHDIERGSIKHYKRAVKVSLAKWASNGRHVVDLFAGCLDQLGLLEMKSPPNSTNGVIVLSDSFMASTFHQSFLCILNKDDQDFLEMSFNATRLGSRKYLGHVISEGKKSACVGDTEIVIRQTSAWRLSAISLQTSTAVYFEVPGSQGLIQFVMHYQHSSGQWHLHVMTIVRNFTKAGSPSIATSLDQEAATVLMIDGSPDVSHWLDWMLIWLCQKFADYRKGDPASCRLSDNFSIYLQFIFCLQRSQFLQAASYRHILNEEDANNSLIMIQPTFDVLPQPVLLDNVSIKPNIILLDMFFHILMFHRETFSWWRKAGCQDHGSYENFKELLEALVTGAQLKLNPSTMHMMMSIYSTAAGTSTGPVIFMDDVSLQVFMEHLKRLVHISIHPT